MRTTLAFVDTNVLLYAASTNPTEAAKQKAAREVLSEGPFAVSTQVLMEFYVNATRKLKPPLNGEDAFAFIKALMPAPIVGMDFTLFEQAVELHTRYQISLWDGAIVAAAKQLGTDTLYSEDMSHGQIFDGVQVINPFQQSASSTV
jgi:predicted nucleic acid-binding protein